MKLIDGMPDMPDRKPGAALKNALALAGRGNPILPLYGIVERDGHLGCMCGNPDCGKKSGKHPHSELAPRGKDDATLDPAVIKKWDARVPGINYGMATGRITVLDQDGEKGRAAVGRLQKENKPFPRSWTVSTGSPGNRHFWFEAPEGVLIPNSVGKIAKGVDVRGAGGYVVIPGSRHYSGYYYEFWKDWHPSKRKLAPLPGWLCELMLAAGGCDKNGNKAPRPASEWREMFGATIGEGERNDSIARLCGKLLNGFLDPGIVLEMLVAWDQVHCRPPIGPAEVESIVCSIADRESRKKGV
jgi:hypothetical protein